MPFTLLFIFAFSLSLTATLGGPGGLGIFSDKAAWIKRVSVSGLRPQRWEVGDAGAKPGSAILSCENQFSCASLASGAFSPSQFSGVILVRSFVSLSLFPKECSHSEPGPSPGELNHVLLCGHQGCASSPLSGTWRVCSRQGGSMVRGTELGLWSLDLVLNQFCHIQLCIWGQTTKSDHPPASCEANILTWPTGCPHIPWASARRPRTVGGCYLKSGVSCCENAVALVYWAPPSASAECVIKGPYFWQPPAWHPLLFARQRTSLSVLLPACACDGTLSKRHNHGASWFRASDFTKPRRRKGKERES